MVNIEFDGIPEELVGGIEKFHNKYINFFPKWVQTVTYSYKHSKEDSPNTVAENYTSYPYRRILINIYSNYVSSKAKYREEVFIHEMVHSFSGIFAIPAFNIVDKLIKDEDSKQIILEELVEKVEAFTQDMAFSILTEADKTNTIIEDLTKQINELKNKPIIKSKK